MVKKKEHGLLSPLFQWRDFRLKLFVEAILIGFLSGALVVFFRFMLEKSEEVRDHIYLLLGQQGLPYYVLWFLILVAIGLLLGYIVKLVPMSTGSGIPQVKGILTGQLKMNWLRVILAKFIGGVLAIGAGLSLGREGPSVQLGAAIGQGISRMLGRLRIEEKYLITSGASAGLAAAFNAPLAGVIFALEELHKNFSPAVLMSAMAASLTADFVSQQFFGPRPIFSFQALPVLPTYYFVHLIGLGIVCGVLGFFFNWSLIKALNFYSKLTIMPKIFVPVLPLILGGFLGFYLPEALGGGHKLIDSLAQGNLGLKMLVIFFIAKFFFTMASFGSGVPGGIFLPLLVIGALVGNIYGDIVITLLHIDPYFRDNFIVFAMAAYFSAIVKAPVTGSILITEMTGSFHHLLALITVSMVSYVVCDILNSKPVYELLLDRILANKDPRLSKNEGKNKVIIELATCIGSTLDGKRIKDILWPPHCLLVSIKRGEQEIIPKGDTKILGGDYLFIVVSEDQAPDVNQLLTKLAGEGS
ncbi:Cl- channel, voltage-gated family protein [Desulforamulus reducens MI-1]|uniref:Cl-channel, voltage-gated family protein n=1 Tax=Desulforamulus reducens (strain ATCC BAA-1160 / DSM 100696 / MI-1) TaxID=349161 RepID=A4J8P4_DESRM|nr:ClC family H(+)/Cl(-) exchange transporter [Desulforamulus reducens]ABO51447.1 Cl- channel, voltage-gated family protein [Desulforamulus reducens MI-1]